MKEKLKAVFDSKVTWGAIGMVVGAIHPAAGVLVNAVGQFVMSIL